MVVVRGFGKEMCEVVEGGICWQLRGGGEGVYEWLLGSLGVVMRMVWCGEDVMVEMRMKDVGGCDGIRRRGKGEMMMEIGCVKMLLLLLLLLLL